MRNITKKRRNIWIAVASLILITCILCIALTAIYLGTYYHADKDAIEAFSQGAIQYEALNNGIIMSGSPDSDTAFIFYPGGKVEHTAYIPLMQALSEQGILCFLVPMPYRLAIFDINAADSIIELFPDISNWYIGGHSLGGSMAAQYAFNNAQKISGLILLASYTTVDISNTELKVLSIYGTEDRVLSSDKYNKYSENLPASMKEIIIEGGCHSYFGMYGIQKGDGQPSLSNEEQILKTAKYISDFICYR